MQKSKKYIATSINVSNTEQLLKLKKEYSQGQRISFICKDCGKSFITTLKASQSVKDLCPNCLRKQTNLSKYGTTSASKSDKVKAKAAETCIKKYGSKSALGNKDIRQKAMNTCVQKYGVDNVFKSKKIQTKIKATIKNTYGVDNVSKLKEVKQRKELSMREHFNVSYPSQSPEIRQKIQQSCFAKYGVCNPAKAEEVKQTILKTNIKRYGVDNPQKNSAIKAKVKNTCLDKYGYTSYLSSDTYKEHMRNTYGYEYALQNSEIKEKSCETSMEHFGTKYPAQSKEVQEKMRNTCMKKYKSPTFLHSASFKKQMKKRYGVEHPLVSKLSYNKENFDSSWELAFYIYYSYQGFTVTRPKTAIPYTYENKTHFYYPDFEIDGQLYEIKGDQFFKDNRMVNPFDHTKDGLFEAKHQCMLQNNIKILTQLDLTSIIEWVNEEFTPDFLKLFQKDLPFPYPTQISKREDIIRVYHRSIWSARRQHKPSPLEAWNDKELVLKSALNRLKYVGKCTPRDVRNGFNIAKIAPKISIFSIGRAEYLINKYLSEFDTVFDPFSGFSGRMMGCVGNKKHYIGQDIKEDHVRESNEIIKDFNLENVSVIQKDILESSGEYPCLFTCPPYGGKEHWNVLNDEIEKSCDEWIDECLKRFKCKYYLFVIDKTTKYNRYIVETIVNKSHFGKNEEYVVAIKG